MLAEVAAFRQEVNSIVALSNSSHLPLGYGFMLAYGVRLSPEELQTGPSEEQRRVSDALLGAASAALRLAAFSSESSLDTSRVRRLTALGLIVTWVEAASLSTSWI